MPGVKSAKKPAPPSANAFVDVKTKPTRSQLVAALAGAAKVWDELVARGKEEFGLTEEWKSYSPKYGWAMRLRRKDRNILHMSPCRGYFLTLCILGDRAVASARASGLPKHLAAILQDAPKYPEGTGMRIPVKKAGDLDGLVDLMRIKLEN